MAKRPFHKSLSDHCVGRSLSCWKGHGVQSPWLAVSQTYLSALFNFQRPVGESIGFHV
ncbi:hypothetical protein BN185_220008 [Clostridioides difficile E28]|nr:hypothetical protein BN185_220008 [Clostridioides difficile E28]